MRRVCGSGALNMEARKPDSFCALIKPCSERGAMISSAMLRLLSRRLIRESWSPLSRIWKEEGRPASRWCRRKKRWQRPWNVPSHMARTLTGIIAPKRVCISLAALLVNVTAIMLCTLACPLCKSHAMRVVSTRVLPLPAPAKTRADCGGQVTAESCSGFKPCSRLGADSLGNMKRPSEKKWECDILKEIQKAV